MERGQQEALRRIEENYKSKDKSLYLGNLNLKVLPDEINKLVHLVKLDLRSNKIDEIKGLKQLQKLTILDLSSNKVEKIEGLYQLQKLTVLALSSNRLGKIEGLEQLQNLTILDLNFNRIRKIEGLDQLQKLVELHLEKNQISKIEQLDLQKNLAVLDLSSNRINKIEGLDKLQKLMELHLRENRVNEIDGIAQLKNLEVLDISSNQINKIDGLERQKNLTDLNLSFNQVEKIEGLEQLQKLTTLNLVSNKIKRIEGLTHQKRLKTLVLHHNLIGKIEGLEQLKNLSKLYLHRNQVKRIEGLEQQKKLTILDLGLNQVSKIVGLDYQTKLSAVNLASNHITNLKSDIFIKNKLLFIANSKNFKSWMNKGFNIYGNPLEHPPIEIAERGVEAIERYFSEIERTGKVQVNAAKLLLIGSGGVGKTSFRTKLNDRDAPLPKKEDRTKQVDIGHYTFSKGNNKENFNTYIWDFGGQQIIHHFHRFFMNKSALYLLMTETCRDDDQLDYWLQTIQLYGKESPIIFVQNQMNGIPKAMDVKPLKAHFNIQDKVYKVNLLNNDGLNDLEKAIQFHLQNLPFTKQTVPTSWFNIDKALQNEAKAKHNYFITFDRFREICKEVADITTKDGIKDVADFLHQLGSILWYAQNPLLKQKVILERHWATEGIFKIIFNEAISKTGKFSLEDAEKIWETDEAYCFYVADLIEMMKEFRICISTKSDPNLYLVPALLTENEPENVEWIYDKRLIVEYQYTTILPRGLVNHLSAEMSNYIKKDHLIWNTGVWLNDKNAQAKIAENRFERKITIEIAGESYRELFGAIKVNMEIIQKDYGGLTYNLMIPCTCSTCSDVALRKQRYYTYDELLQRKERGKATIECSISYDDVPIKDLLDNIEISKEVDAIKIFISYAREDLSYREKLERQLKPFLRKKLIDTIWTDHEILPGQNWDREIEDNLKKANLVFLLISDDFFTSDYIDEKELPIIEKKYRSKDCIVIPILVRPSAHWADSKWSFLQAIPETDEDELKPISEWEDLAWKEVTDAIRRVL